MSVYRRGEVWWYCFMFKGQLIRESSASRSKTVAKEGEKQRRRELEDGFNGIPKPKRVVLFSSAAKIWLDGKADRAGKTRACYEQRLRYVNAELGKRLVCDINADDVIRYRATRSGNGASGRTINYEVGCIRGVLKANRAWAEILEEFSARDLKVKLKENSDVGRALSAEDEAKLLLECKRSTAPSLLTLFIFGRDTGLRAAEIKALRLRDLQLKWKDGNITKGEVVVPKSKTEEGKGRAVPFSPDVCSTLTLWLSRFPDATSDSFLFPRHAVQQVKGTADVKITDVKLDKAVQSWQRAWRTALKAAGVHYRWHDLRHTFISRLCENPNVSEETIRALAGHVSKKMLERYSHIRQKAKEEAIASNHARQQASARKAQKLLEGRHKIRHNQGFSETPKGTRPM